jgi:hypothetical protein
VFPARYELNFYIRKTVKRSFGVNDKKKADLDDSSHRPLQSS